RAAVHEGAACADERAQLGGIAKYVAAWHLIKRVHETGRAPAATVRRHDPDPRVTIGIGQDCAGIDRRLGTGVEDIDDRAVQAGGVADVERAIEDLDAERADERIIGACTLRETAAPVAGLIRSN